MEDGWIKLHRKILKWEWYDDINTKVLFFHLLLTANHEDRKWHGIFIKRGQRLTSLSKLSQECMLSVRQVRVSLTKLKMTHEVTSESTSQYTVITINNYCDYQSNDKPIDQRVTNERQTNDKRMTTNKKEKKEKKDILLSNESKAFGNADVNFVINSFKEVFGFEPATHRGQNPRQTAWAYTQKLRKIIREKKGAEFTGSDELFRKATMKFFEWVRCQEWSEGVVSLRPMLVHLNKFLETQR